MFENYKVFETDFAGRPLKIETGKIAQLANGACFVRYGDTVVNVAAVSYTHLDVYKRQPMCKLNSGALKYQLIQNRNLEKGGEPDFTRGTLEGDIAPGKITFYRLQSTADTKLTSYIAQGEILTVATRSFGGIGIFAISEMDRFYRHVPVSYTHLMRRMSSDVIPSGGLSIYFLRSFSVFWFI